LLWEHAGRISSGILQSAEVTAAAIAALKFEGEFKWGLSSAREEVKINSILISL
jgi:hypothetical protein